MSTWIHTHTGVAWDLARPLAEKVSMDDIAHALSQINRFNGHGKFPLSVAEHSVHVCRMVHKRTLSAEAARVALFHDAHEAYVGDIVTPMKNMLGEAYRSIERGNLRAVMEAIGIDEVTQERWWPAVARADAEMLAIEKRWMFDIEPETWVDEAQIEPLRLPWHRARDFFRAEASFYGVKL